MRKNFLRPAFCGLMFAFSSIAFCQLPYWQQQVNYTIDVTLNDKEHTLDAFAKIEYVNQSPDTLKFIWFHVWPNAYKHDRTAFSDQLLENGNTKFYFSNKEDRGYINRMDFKVNNVTASTEDHPEHSDIIKLILPAPLAPGQKAMIFTPFHVKLPYNFSRGGHDGQSYQVTQWYPKPAVYDKDGWHPMPYLDQGEYYSEFGNYDVRITLPKNYVVAATGELQDADERSKLQASGYKPQATPDNISVKKNTSGNATKTREVVPPSDPQSKTLKYTQNNVHDFAWFANKNFIVNYDTCKLTSGKVIDVYTYYTPLQKDFWQNSIQFCKDAVRFYSEEAGEYPYNIVSAVQGPESFGGGMEYPTITVISPMADEKSIDATIAHEIGHNWFYGILASNERRYPWLDEGLNSFYDNKYVEAKYGKAGKEDQILFETKAISKTDQPIQTPSEKLSFVNYGLSAYYKTAKWMSYLESVIGTAALHTAMHNYYDQWKFRHPQPADFQKSIETSTGKDLDTVFALLDKNGTLPNQQRTGSKIVTLLNPKSFEAYFKEPSQQLFIINPAIGFNSYDKFMAGVMFTNYKLPPSPFQFLLVPMYATGSKTFTTIGKLNYSLYSDGKIRKVDLFVNGSTFTQNMFTDTAGKKTFLGFNKIVPGIRLTFKQSSPRSNLHKFIQWKTFFIGEEGLRFSRDTIITGIDTSIVNSYSKAKENRVLNQLKFVVENARALYPFSGELNIEQAEDFIRAAFTGKYFFNYSKEGGLNVRVFAGKFFYAGSKTLNKQFSTERYHLNMTGPNGHEDYTYSDYFIGRNKFEGFASQQIMMRDGGFKVRTDLLADKVGKTDDWLAAVNFSTSIPSKINPLSVLPFKIPLRIFADIGTYAPAWEKDSELDRFLFDAGLHFALLNQTINVYVPLIYSRVYKDYIQSTIPKEGRLFKTISFNIDISNFDLKNLGPRFRALW